MKVCARYGAIAGLLGVVLLISLYYFGKHPFLIPVFFDFRIILLGIFIFFALKEYRDAHNQGVLYFWEGMIGSLTFVVAFAGVGAVAILIFTTLKNDFLTSYIQLTIEQVKMLPPEIVEKIGKDVVERNISELPDTKVIDLSKLYIFQSFVIGFFISIIISVILRRQPKN